MQHWSSILSLGILGAVAVGMLSTRGTAEEAKPTSDTRIFELRTYTAAPGKLDALNARFRDHTMRLFEKHGMKNVIYLTPTDEQLSKNTLIYLLVHESPEAAEKSWAAFRSDPEWHKARDASEKDGKLVLKVESQYLKATDYSPLKK